MAITRILKESNTFPFSFSNLTTGVSATANIITRHHEPTCNHYRVYIWHKKHTDLVFLVPFLSLYFINK